MDVYFLRGYCAGVFVLESLNACMAVKICHGKSLLPMNSSAILEDLNGLPSIDC